jgi:hypothetical protein
MSTEVTGKFWQMKFMAFMLNYMVKRGLLYYS